jgi:uncharacterized protein (TIGR02118 family)
MFKVSVMYPYEKGAKFDFDYYRTKHMALVEKHMKPFGLIKVGVDQGLSGGGDAPPPYICVGHLYFNSRNSYEKATAQAGLLLRGDIANFITVKPIRLISEILD